MTLNLDDLEATARAVLPELPNPWLEDEGGVVLHPDQPGNSWDGYIVCEVPADGYRRRPVKAHIAAFDPPTVLALIARLREAEAKLPPCDGGCSYGIGPEETCSAHGRPPAEIWGIVASVAAERDAAQGQLGEAEHVIAQILDYDGPEAADMRDIALAYEPTNQEGANDHDHR